MNLGEWLRSASQKLDSCGIESPALEASLLAAYALNVERTWVLSHPEATVDNGNLNLLLSRRCMREPLAYILGQKEFYGRMFAVRPGVLIPRPDSETLITAALELIATGAQVWDLCCGSGCLGITIKLERPSTHVSLSDLSPVAIEVSQSNAKNLGAEVEVELADGLVAFGNQRFDLIVSNPPYVEIGAELQPEVGEFEPPEALFAGEDGLDFYRKIAAEFESRLVPDGWLLLELGAGQSDAVSSLFSGFTQREWRDLSGQIRVLGVRNRLVSSLLA